MTQSGMMIRLIDVVLILLFGFISISELSQKSPIQLPVSSQVPASPPDTEEVLFVSITAEGQYFREDRPGIYLAPEDLPRLLENAKRAAALKGLSLRVRLRSNWNTPIKYTMYAADLCDNLGISKGVEVQRMGR